MPVNTGKMCYIAFILKTTGFCKFFLCLQDPVIAEPCIFIALGSSEPELPSLPVPFCYKLSLGTSNIKDISQ